MNSSDISGRPYDKLADAEKKKLFRNASYWAKRLEELAENQNLKGDEYVKASEKLYRKAQKSIEDKINAWYGRFAKNNDISFSEAQKRLKTDELEEFKWTVEEYIEKARQSADGSYLKELENASARVHVNRLEFMNTQLEAAARLLYNSTENGLKGLLGDIYEDTYYRSIFEIQKGYGVGASFSRLDTKLIDKVLSQPWAQDGSNFSSRVWSNKEELVRKLKTDFSQSLIRGESRDKIISRLSKDLEQDRKKTARLVHTETAALQNKAALDAYKELGVDKVRILGTLDSVTCSLCGSMDGMILPRTQLEQGVTEPPFHPNCRCTTVPYDEDWDYKGQRIAKDKDGKYYYVPETMSYEEWKREFADQKLKNNSKSRLDNSENMQASIVGKANSGKNFEFLRKTQNTGDFEEYPVLLELKTVKSLATKYDIDTNGLKFKIRRDKELKRIPILGRADKKRVGQIELYPNAFTSEEQLVKTLLHERHHVLQLRKYGKEFCDGNYSLMEKQAYRAEELFYTILKKRVDK